MTTPRPGRWAAILLVSVTLPNLAQAQTIGFEPVGPGNVGPGGRALWVAGGSPYGYGYPGWRYPGIPGGPFVGYAYPYSLPFYRGANGATWSNGLSLLGPPVPVYGPIPGMFGAQDLNAQWHAHPSLGYGFGWLGVYSPSPRPRPTTVNVWPANDPRAFAAHHGKVYRNGVITEEVPGPAVPPAQPGGCLVISVKVPQPAAEVYVDGVKMAQTGTNRIFESPALEAGNHYQYDLTARWVEGGAVRECKRTVVGKPGELLRVDFCTPEVVVTGGK